MSRHEKKRREERWVQIEEQFKKEPLRKLTVKHIEDGIVEVSMLRGKDTLFTKAIDMFT